MQVHEFELSVGDVLHIDNRVLTVIDIEAGEIRLRVDDCPTEDAAAAICDSAGRPEK